MSAGWWFLMPFPGALPMGVLLLGITAAGWLRACLWPPEERGGCPPPHGRTGPYVPRTGTRPLLRDMCICACHCAVTRATKNGV